MTRTNIAALLLAALLSPAAIAAQEHPAGSRWNGVELWGGIASRSPSWGVLGQAPDMNFGVLGVRFLRELGSGPGADARRVTEFTVDLVPFATVSPSYISLRGTGANCAPRRLCVLPPGTSSREGLFPPGSSRGFGFNPAGVTTRWRRDRAFSPSLGVAVGGLWFDKRVPTTRSSQFNFTAALEAGVRLGRPHEPGLTVSYRFHHISNAGTAGENPGLASHLVSLGIHRGRGDR